MSDFQSFQEMRQRMRGYSRMSVAAKLQMEVKRQQAMVLDKASPDGKRAELESLIAQKQTDATHVDMQDVDARGLKLDGMKFAGKMNSRTYITRAVNCSFDNMEIKAARLATITGSSFKKTRMQDVRASNTDRTGCDFTGGVHARNDLSRGSNRDQKWLNVNAFANSFDQSDMDGVKIAGGWHTQGYYQNISINNGSVVAADLGGSNFSNMFGRNVNFQPKLTDANDYVLHGANLGGKISHHVAVKAQDENADVRECRIVGDSEAPKPERKAMSRHDRFAALDADHKHVTGENDNDAMLPELRPYRADQGLRIATVILGLAA